MTPEEQGKILLAWRARYGQDRGIKATQQDIADQVDELARKHGVPAKGRGIPRTRESLARWETGKHNQSTRGLALLAEVYGTDLLGIMQYPPAAAPPPQPPPDPDHDAVAALEAALATLKAQLQKA